MATVVQGGNRLVVTKQLGGLVETASGKPGNEDLTAAFRARRNHRMVVSDDQFARLIALAREEGPSTFWLQDLLEVAVCDDDDDDDEGAEAGGEQAAKGGGGTAAERRRRRRKVAEYEYQAMTKGMEALQSKKRTTMSMMRGYSLGSGLAFSLVVSVVLGFVIGHLVFGETTRAALLSAALGIIMIVLDVAMYVVRLGKPDLKAKAAKARAAAAEEGTPGVPTRIAGGRVVWVEGGEARQLQAATAAAGEGAQHEHQGQVSGEEEEAAAAAEASEEGEEKVGEAVAEEPAVAAAAGDGERLEEECVGVRTSARRRLVD